MNAFELGLIVKRSGVEEAWRTGKPDRLLPLSLSPEGENTAMAGGTIGGGLLGMALLGPILNRLRYDADKAYKQ